jgi:hypothetical protein
MMVFIIGLLLLFGAIILLGWVGGMIAHEYEDIFCGGVGLLLIVGLAVTAIGTDAFFHPSWEDELFDGTIKIEVTETELSYTINETGEWEIEWGVESWGGWSKTGQRYHNITLDELPFTNEEKVEGGPGCPIEYIEVKWDGKEEFVEVDC